MIVLGIETTCDETSAAIVRNGKEILSNVVASQVEVHQPYGGVFPELACRKHIDLLIPVIEQAMDEAHVSQKEIDLVAVAKGPGLIGALLIGLNAAKGLSLAWNKPFIGVNHVEAHLYAAMMSESSLLFPAIGVVISGGHTFLVRILDIGIYELIGTTVDDAIGEAFDKVAAMLGLPYPGGPAIEQLALLGDPTQFAFKAGKVKENIWNFSFSGLKTNVLYTIKGKNAGKEALLKIEEKDKPHIAAAFQQAALSEVVQKSLKAVHHFDAKAVYLGGGVSNNQRLRQLFKEQAPHVPILWPPFGLSLDNAAMIGGLGLHVFKRQGRGDPLDLEPMARIPLDTQID